MSTILFYLMFGLVCVLIVAFSATGVFCIVALSSKEKVQEDEEQMKWLRENMERKSARKKPKMYMK